LEEATGHVERNPSTTCNRYRSALPDDHAEQSVASGCAVTD
jgi:hypothetical protein